MSNSFMDAPIYWVLWMPTTTHNILIAKSPFERLVEGNISDNASYEQTVTAQLDDNNNIQLCFSSIIQSGNTMKIVEKSSVIELKYIDSSSNGLFLYECQCVTNDEVTKRLAKTPRHATIHLLKKLYHKHVFHGTSKDNNITDFYFDVYISDSKPDIKEENNGAILHYLQEIEEKFKNAVEYFEIDLIAMRDHKKHIKQIVKRQLFKHYNVLLGETFFYNTLCSSKYLNAIGIAKDNAQKLLLKDKVRKLLFNVNNSKSYLYYIRDFYKYQIEDDFWVKSFRLAIHAIWISVALSIISLVYTIYTK